MPGTYTCDCSIGSHAANGMVVLTVNAQAVGCTDIVNIYDASSQSVTMVHIAFRDVQMLWQLTMMHLLR